MRGRRDWKGLESSLIYRPGADTVSAAMPTMRVGSRDPLDQPREPLRSHRSDDEVPVCGKNAVRDQSQRITSKTLVEGQQEASIISWTLKERSLADTAIDDVKEAGWAGRTWATWHGASGRSKADARAAPWSALSPLESNLWKWAPSP